MQKGVGTVVATAATTRAAMDLHLATPLAFGILGVILARIVFVDRENRRSTRPQRFRETLPLTAVASLIAFALIVEYDLNLPKAIFTGLGVGWVAIAALDLIGERLLALLGFARAKDAPAPEPLPERPVVLDGPIKTPQQEGIGKALNDAFGRPVATTSDQRSLLDEMDRNDEHQ